MTDADDERLIKKLRGSLGYFVGRSPAFRETLINAADRLEAQGKEIAELRTILAEAIDVFDGIDEDVVGISATLNAIDAFRAKYGDKYDRR